jgi:hypothetical protein
MKDMERCRIDSAEQGYELIDRGIRNRVVAA